MVRLQCDRFPERHGRHERRRSHHLPDRRRKLVHLRRFLPPRRRPAYRRISRVGSRGAHGGGAFHRRLRRHGCSRFGRRPFRTIRGQRLVRLQRHRRLETERRNDGSRQPVLPGRRLGLAHLFRAFVLPDGRHLIEYLATDVAGLSGPIQSLVIAVDTTPPTTVAALSGQEGSNGWFVSNVTVFLNATDALSGLANLSYRIDNGSWQTYSAPFLLAEGLHQVDFLAIDLAGNVEALQSLNVAIDTTPPTTSAIVSGTLGLNGWTL